MATIHKPAKGRHPREGQAAWLEILLLEQLTSVKDLYLYGSASKLSPFELETRGLENFDESSDYDFAVQDSAAVHDQLVSLGWQKKDELPYQDAQTVHIFENQVDGERVQISLRVELDKFKEVWGSIPAGFYWRFLNKRSPTFIGRENVKIYLDQLYFLTKGYFSGSATTISGAAATRFGSDWERVNWVEVAA